MNEVLIATHATTVSTGDCNMRNFTLVTKSMLPFAKLTFGIRKPWKARVLGTELVQELLINGASGSIGSAGVQLAKHCGALVSAVCSGANVDMVKSQGADRVIDYTKEDFTSRADTYDLIF